MTMLNQAHLDAIVCANYLNHYVECVEALPNDLQRVLTQIREVDLEHAQNADSFDRLMSQLSDSGSHVEQGTVNQLHHMLIQMQEFEDEKIRLSASLMDFIEVRAKQLESDKEDLDPATPIAEQMAPSRAGNSSTKRSNSAVEPSKNGPSVCSPAAAEHKQESKVNSSSAKKRRPKSSSAVSAPPHRATSNNSRTPQQPSAGQSGNATPNREDNSSKKATPAAEARSTSKLPLKRKRRSRVGTQAKAVKEKEPSLEPEEPTYCICDQISYGEMIGCDNDACPIEWFHFGCVGLVNKPKGRWYCPKCRGDKQTVMKKGR